MNSCYSIDKQLCLKTYPDILECINLCRNCLMFPLTSYFIKDTENHFCKSCYNLLNINPQQTIPPSKSKLLNKLIINCKYFENGCQLEFSVKTMDEMVNHINKCEFNKSDNDEKPLHCKRCQTIIIHMKDHDCFINFQNKTEKEFESKLLQLEQKLLNRIGNYEDILNKTIKTNNNTNQYYQDKFHQFEKIIHETLN